MSALSLWLFLSLIITGPLQWDPNPRHVTHLVNLLYNCSDIYILALDPRAYLPHSSPPLSPITTMFCFFPLTSYVESRGRKWSLTPVRVNTPLSCWAFRLCLFSKLYVCECCSGDPVHPSPTNSTTSDIPLLAPVHYTPWENTTALEKEGWTSNQ